MLDTWRIGESKRINEVISADDAFTVSSATITIYGSDGVAVVTGAVCTIDPAGLDTEHEVYYVWTPVAAGDYTYLLRYVVGTQMLGVRGSVFVLPVVSKYDRWVDAVLSLVQEPAVGEDQQSLEYRDLMRAVDQARRRYQMDWPQRKLNNAAGELLTASVWEYSLPTDWADGFSQIVEFEYPVDATLQSRPFLAPGEIRIDALRSKWSFTNASPSAGQYARYLYTTQHTLSHTADTLPDHHFSAIALYAAGAAMEQLANEATRTDSQGQGADVVNYRTKQQERRAQAQVMKREAVAGWQNTVWGM